MCDLNISKEIIIHFGKYKGSSLFELLEKDKEYIRKFLLDYDYYEEDGKLICYDKSLGVLEEFIGNGDSYMDDCRNHKKLKDFKTADKKWWNKLINENNKEQQIKMIYSMRSEFDQSQDELGYERSRDFISFYIRSYHYSTIMKIRKYLIDSRKCFYCLTTLRSIGWKRSNGKDHDDWKERKLHKKCWKYLLTNSF